MFKLLLICCITLVSLFFASSCRAESEKNGKGKGYATRTIENGTTIQLVVGDTVIPAVLNNSKSSQALIAKLPYTVRLQRYEHDYCGVMNELLPYDKKDMRNGWLNGDVSFAVNGNYFTILYKDEEMSEKFDGIVNMGVLTAPLSVMDTLDSSISMRIELAQ